MKIIPVGTLEDLKKLNRAQFHNLWFNRALTDRQIAKMYNTNKNEVKKIRKELKLGFWSATMAYLCGGSKYKKHK